MFMSNQARFMGRAEERSATKSPSSKPRMKESTIFVISYSVTFICTDLSAYAYTINPSLIVHYRNIQKECWFPLTVSPGEKCLCWGGRKTASGEKYSLCPRLQVTFYLLGVIAVVNLYPSAAGLFHIFHGWIPHAQAEFQVLRGDWPWHKAGWGAPLDRGAWQVPQRQPGDREGQPWDDD